MPIPIIRFAGLASLIEATSKDVGEAAFVCATAIQPGISPAAPGNTPNSIALTPAAAPTTHNSAQTSWPMNIRGSLKILPAPGFDESAPVVMAIMGDGTHVVLKRQPGGTVRVSGVAPRWPDIPPAS